MLSDGADTPKRRQAPQGVTAGRTLRLAAVALFAAGSLLFLRWIPDDAFISFRYARNLAGGLGLVFNPGEIVKGISNPLWTLLLAGTTRIGLDTVATAVALSLACALAGVWLTFQLFDMILTAGGADHRRFTGLKALLGFGAIASLPTLFYATSGLETHGELLLLLLGSVWHLEAVSRSEPRRHFLSMLAFLAVALMRPEGVVFLLVAAALTITNGRRDRRTRAWIAAAVAVPVVLYTLSLAVDYAYYGALVPNTYLAKPGASMAYPAPIWRGTQYLARFFLISGLFVMLPFCAIAFAHRPARHACVYLSSMVGAQLAFIVFVGGDVLRFNRFTVPLLPMLLAVALVGFIRWDSVTRVRSPRLALFTAGLCVALMAGLNGGRVYLARSKYCLHDWMHATVHRRVGEALGRALDPGASVVVNEVGAIAYESRLLCYDMIGLTDRTVAALIYESFQRDGVSASASSAREIADYLFSREPTCVLIPATGAIDPARHEKAADRLHPIWEAVFTHPDLTEHFRFVLSVRIHEHKYWYIFVRNGAPFDSAPLRGLSGPRCLAVSH